MKMIKSLSKKTKIIVVGVISLVLIASATGITLYAKDIESKVQQTQSLYHGIKIADTEKYNVVELAEFNALQDKRKLAFDTLNITALQTLQADFDALNTTVTERIEKEQRVKQYADKKAEIDGINIVDGSTLEEQAIFNERKQTALNMVADMKPFDEIVNAISQLMQTNIDIQARKQSDVDAQLQSSVGSSSGGYENDDSYDYDDDYSGGGSTGGSNPGGGSTPPTDDGGSFVPPGWGSGCDASSCWSYN